MNKTITITETNAIAFFERDEIDKVLSDIEGEARSLVPDLTTDKGRKEIASLARKISSSKVVLFNAGKALTKGWKDKAKLVDESKRILTIRLDALRDEVRQPLTDYENAEKARIELEKLVKQVEGDHLEALTINELIDRERAIEVKEREAKIEADRVEAERLAYEQKIEADRLAKEESERVKRERLAYEQKIKDDAVIEERRIREADNIRIKQEAQAKIEEAARVKAEAIAEKERLKRKELEAEKQKKLDDDRVENERVAALKKAEQDKENAILKANEDARVEADRVEKIRLAKIEDERVKAEKLSSDRLHRKTVNYQAVDSFVANGFSREKAISIVELIVKHKIDSVTINY